MPYVRFNHVSVVVGTLRSARALPDTAAICEPDSQRLDALDRVTFLRAVKCVEEIT